MLKKIAVARLTLGMHVREFCGSWLDHPFWREDFVIDNEDDLRKIQTCSIKEVWIDVARGADVAGATKPEAQAQIDVCLGDIPLPRPATTRAPLIEEVRRAARICAQGKESVVSMFQEARMGKAVDHAAAGTEKIVSREDPGKWNFPNLDRIWGSAELF